MSWAGHLACLEERRGTYRVLVGKPEGKRPLGRPSHRWEDNIKMDLQEVGCGAWTGLIWLTVRTGGWLLWSRNEHSGQFCYKSVFTLAVIMILTLNQRKSWRNFFRGKNVFGVYIFWVYIVGRAYLDLLQTTCYCGNARCVRWPMGSKWCPDIVTASAFAKYNAA